LSQGRKRTNLMRSDFVELDIRLLQCEGMLLNGISISLQWKDLDEVRASATISSFSSYVSVSYRDELTRPGTTRLQLGVEWARCHYGGTRVWFRCLRPDCGRRAAILYGRQDFACRTCRHFSYPTQRLTVLGRAMFRAQKLRVGLGGASDLDQPFPSRPKRMHTWTYTRIALRAHNAECELSDHVAGWVEEMRGRRGPQSIA
jgi:hypothetical protein